MHTSRYLVLAILPALLFFQNCKKERANVIPEVHEHETWNYEHPETWGAASGDCNGVIQSPIDINTFATLKSNLPDLEFSYVDFPFSIIDNGHTIQVNTGSNDALNMVVFNNKAYKLKQFHFHAKSEHTVNGEHSPMELHMVHATEEGEILVVGLLVEKGAANNKLADLVLQNLPTEKKKEQSRTVMINMNDVLPAGKGYYNYIGSLTTPPCSMGLQWIVMKDRLQLSASQISSFEQLYDDNYRPVQQLNNRVVYEKID